jgi:hypothetical protein
MKINYWLVNASTLGGNKTFDLHSSIFNSIITVAFKS